MKGRNKLQNYELCIERIPEVGGADKNSNKISNADNQPNNKREVDDLTSMKMRLFAVRLVAQKSFIAPNSYRDRGCISRDRISSTGSLVAIICLLCSRFDP